MCMEVYGGVMWGMEVCERVLKFIVYCTEVCVGVVLGMEVCGGVLGGRYTREV